VGRWFESNQGIIKVIYKISIGYNKLIIKSSQDGFFSKVVLWLQELKQ
jgi:hypothetical protein